MGKKAEKEKHRKTKEHKKDQAKRRKQEQPLEHFIAGIVMGAMMFGDIGIACIVGALSALLSGFGFLSANKKMRDVN